MDGCGNAEQGRARRFPQRSQAERNWGGKMPPWVPNPPRVSPQVCLPPSGHRDTETEGHLEPIRMASIPHGDVLTGPLDGIS